MKQLLLTLCFVFSICFNLSVLSQELVAKTGSFGIDVKNKIIVWHITNLDSVKHKYKNNKTIKFTKKFEISNATVENLSYLKKNIVTNGGNYSLYISKLPLIHLKINTASINNYLKIPGYFTFFSNQKYIKTVMGLRHRGNLSLSFAKKSFDLEFWKDSINMQTKDIEFKGLRSDDDWILDAMFNEPLRLRSFIAANLWSKIHKPYYAKKEPKAKSGFGVKYVEVFKNNEYYGIYQLSESLDRKQLKLKENIKNSIYGELYKANSYDGGPDFTKSPEKYNNLSMYWNGWATRYPYIDNKSDWKNLSELNNLVVHDSNKTFLETIESKVKISNAIDYYLFVNLLRATDNLGKNYYLGKYTNNEPYFFIPWDLDGVWGVIQDGIPVWNTNDVLENGLFKRLITTNPNNYNAKVKKRWHQLRENEFSNENLFSEINTIYKHFTAQKVYEREQLVWQNKLNKTTNEEHYKHLKSWLLKRLTYLDNHFK